MKNIILQHWTGNLGELEKLSQESIQEYADYCGADYRLLRGSVFDKSLSSQSQKLAMLTEEFDDYDTVVMMDIDMFRRKGATKNIFTDETGIGRHHGIQPTLVKNLQRRFPFLGDPSYAYWGGSIYRLPREMRQKLRKHYNISEAIQFNNNYNDEGVMHRLAVLAGVKNHKKWYLDRQQWNHSSFDEGVDQAEIIHIRPKVKPGGPKAPKIENYRLLVERGII